MAFIANGTTLGDGLSHADQYRVSADFTGDQAPITQWELTDTDGFGGIGTAMGVSSGVFSFAVTGIWLISMYAQVKVPTGTGTAGFVIQTTTDNGTYDTAARSQVTGGDNSNEYLSFMFDVTNVSTHKVKFSCEFDNQASGLGGHSTETKTGCTFLRLGAT